MALILHLRYPTDKRSLVSIPGSVPRQHTLRPAPLWSASQHGNYEIV